MTDGGSAFPAIDVHQNWDRDSREWDGVQTDIVSHGMTLRDYLAAKAMQGYLASGKWTVAQAVNVSQWSYEIADAMLAEREK